MLVSRELAKNIIEVAKQKENKIVFTNGCFDILHVGHVRYLRESKKLGDILIVGMNSDDSVRRLKGESRPVNCEDDRAEVLCALECVDYVSIFDEDTPFELISTIIPDIITKGGDYNPDQIVGADIVAQNGGKVVVINYVEGKSTSKVIEKINQDKL